MLATFDMRVSQEWFEKIVAAKGVCFATATIGVVSDSISVSPSPKPCVT